MEDVSSPENVLGHSRIFTPEVINDIHVKSEPRYRMRVLDVQADPPLGPAGCSCPGRSIVRDRGLPLEVRNEDGAGARFAKHPIELDIPIYITA
jgi:hypothetical protein